MKRMKWKRFALTLALLFGLALPQAAHANMAAPKEADIGSAVTFEQNDAIAVTSEVLDIRVTGPAADITATYQMKNTTGEAVTTPAMFLSPGIEQGKTAVERGGVPLPFTTKRYALNYSTEIGREDWRYAVLTDGESSYSGDRTVDSITFELTLEPAEECEVKVSYRCQLGGYPTLDFDAKVGEIRYYLTPAALWKDFGQLTINLYLDEDMPVVTDSSVAFEKVGERTYRYVSDTLPAEELTVTIDESAVQTFFSTLRSPYLTMTLLAAAPLLLGGLALLLLVIWMLRLLFRKNRLK